MISIMEVCGTHTMSIARAGIKQLLPPGVRLVSGPGCPVCVTCPEVIDEILKLSDRPDVIIATYGDMIRVPGSSGIPSDVQDNQIEVSGGKLQIRKSIYGDNLRKHMACGSDVRIVYSPVDAIDIAVQNPDKEVVFLGVGFETTAPGTAAAIRTAAQKGVKNFSVLSMLKTVEPALRALIASPDFNIQGFLCPGHVATIIGERGFRFLTEEYGIPSVIAGFEPKEIMAALSICLREIKRCGNAVTPASADGQSGQNKTVGISGPPVLVNAYKRAVAPDGNPLAQQIMAEVFEPAADRWRGLGEITDSGLKIRKEWEWLDAEVKFGIKYGEAAANPLCRCGDIICGRLEPTDCPMFSRICTPENPVGPCMVSSEGACAAYYKYV